MMDSMIERSQTPSGSKRLVPLFLAVCLLAAAGCSREGSIRVTNVTEHDITVNIMHGPDQIVPPGGELVETVKISKGFFPPSEREIEVSGRGVVKNFFSVRLVIKNDGEGHVLVEPDAAALLVINEFQCTLKEAFIKLCEVGQWGGNHLVERVRPEGSVSFRLEPGCYDVRLVSVRCPDDEFVRVYEDRILELGKADTLRFRLTGGG
jgi:hypothetical protein